MSQVRTLRMLEVAAYLRVSHQRVTQMYAEGKLPEPAQVDGIGPLWKPGHDRAMGRAGVVGHATLAETVTVCTTTLTLCYYGARP